MQTDGLEQVISFLDKKGVLKEFVTKLCKDRLEKTSKKKKRNEQ